MNNFFFYFCFCLDIPINSTNIIMFYSMFVGLIFLCYIYYLVRFNFGCFQIILLGLSKKTCTLVKVVVHLCRTKGQWNVDLQMLQVHVSYFSLSTLWFIFIYLLYTFIVADHWSCRGLLFGIRDPNSRWNLIFYVCLTLFFEL